MRPAEKRGRICEFPKEKLKDIDLELADDKRDVYPAIANSTVIEAGLFPGYAIHEHNNMVLVGCPMGTDDFIQEHIRNKKRK